MKTRKGKCFICGKVGVTERHHIYEGSRRQASEKNGFVCFLCPEHHTSSDCSVHRDNELNLMLKRYCQREYEKTHTREEFMGIIHKNYLEE